MPKLPTLDFPGTGSFWNQADGEKRLAEWMEFARHPVVLTLLWHNIQEQKVKDTRNQAKYQGEVEPDYPWKLEYFNLIKEGKVTSQIFLDYKVAGTGLSFSQYAAHHLKVIKNNFALAGWHSSQIPNFDSCEELFWALWTRNKESGWFEEYEFTWDQVVEQVTPHWE